ncbi:hypothetical protein DFH27DRAFT_579163 [Peziza echinospora]|nr:hypothetical protein DFH27DRAFT_579163 [Peziza echinospora]
MEQPYLRIIVAADGKKTSSEINIYTYEELTEFFENTFPALFAIGNGSRRGSGGGTSPGKKIGIDMNENNVSGNTGENGQLRPHIHYSYQARLPAYMMAILTANYKETLKSFSILLPPPPDSTSRMLTCMSEYLDHRCGCVTCLTLKKKNTELMEGGISSGHGMMVGGEGGEAEGYDCSSEADEIELDCNDDGKRGGGGLANIDGGTRSNDVDDILHSAAGGSDEISINLVQSDDDLKQKGKDIPVVNSVSEGLQCDNYAFTLKTVFLVAAPGNEYPEREQQHQQPQQPEFIEIDTPAYGGTGLFTLGFDEETSASMTSRDQKIYANYTPITREILYLRTKSHSCVFSVEDSPHPGPVCIDKGVGGLYRPTPEEYVLRHLRSTLDIWPRIVKDYLKFITAANDRALGSNAGTARVGKPFLRNMVRTSWALRALNAIQEDHVALMDFIGARWPLRYIDGDDEKRKRVRRRFRAKLELEKASLDKAMDKSMVPETRQLVERTQLMISVDEGYEHNISMKRLSWITFIFLPLLFVSGLYGMNIDLLADNPSWKTYFYIAVPLFFIILFVVFALKTRIFQRIGSLLSVGIHYAGRGTKKISRKRYIRTEAYALLESAVPKDAVEEAVNAVYAEDHLLITAAFGSSQALLKLINAYELRHSALQGGRRRIQFVFDKALCRAAATGNIACMSLLLDRGAEVENTGIFVERKDMSFPTGLGGIPPHKASSALEMAIACGQVAAAMMLLGYSPNSALEYGLNVATGADPLSFNSDQAVGQEIQAGIVDAFIEEYMRPARYSSFYVTYRKKRIVWMAIEGAAEDGREAIFEHILNVYGASLLDEVHYTCMWIAVANGHWGIINNICKFFEARKTTLSPDELKSLLVAFLKTQSKYARDSEAQFCENLRFLFSQFTASGSSRTRRLMSAEDVVYDFTLPIVTTGEPPVATPIFKPLHHLRVLCMTGIAQVALPHLAAINEQTLCDTHHSPLSKCVPCVCNVFRAIAIGKSMSILVKAVEILSPAHLLQFNWLLSREDHPLELAVEFDFVEMVTYILDHPVFAHQGGAARHILRLAFLSAIRENSCKSISALLRAPLATEQGLPLSFALMTREEWLQVDFFGGLAIAVNNGNLEACKILVIAGAKIWPSPTGIFQRATEMAVYTQKLFEAKHRLRRFLNRWRFRIQQKKFRSLLQFTLGTVIHQVRRFTSRCIDKAFAPKTMNFDKDGPTRLWPVVQAIIIHLPTMVEYLLTTSSEQGSLTLSHIEACVAQSVSENNYDLTIYLLSTLSFPDLTIQGYDGSLRPQWTVSQMKEFLNIAVTYKRFRKVALFEKILETMEASSRMDAGRDLYGVGPRNLLST